MMDAMTESGEHTQNIPAAGGLANVQVTTTGAGTAQVVVDGRDVSRQIASVTIAARPMQIPRVILEVLSDVTWDGNAVVEYRTPAPDADLVKAKTRAWLDGLNWAHIQAAAAEGSMSAGIGEAFRQALIDQLDRDW